MSARRLRPRRGPWRYLFGSVLLLILARWGCERGRVGPLNPVVTPLPAGEYKVRGIRSDGVIEVRVGEAAAGRWMAVRLLSVDLVHEAAAGEWMQASLDGRSVRLRFDRRRLDDQGTLLAYVYLDDVLVNAEIVRQGWARESTHPVDAGPLARQIVRAEEQAKTERRGIWRAEGDSDGAAPTATIASFENHAEPDERTKPP